MAATDSELFYLNGVNGATGTYSIPPLRLDEFVSLFKDQVISAAHLHDLKRFSQSKEKNYAIQPMYDSSDMAQAGWGLVFPAGADPARVDGIIQALGPLIALRTSQCGEKMVKIYRGSSGVCWKASSSGALRTETRTEWLGRQGTAGVDKVDPNIVPYYLLIVADPNSIPYTFQYELDVQYAVGRIYFTSLDEYARYARSVARAASGQVKLARRAVFFGVANPGDRATALSHEYLVKPLARIAQEQSDASGLGWQAGLVDGADATRAALTGLLGGSQAPAFLFSASHGVDFPYGHPEQYRAQGAILCRDWKGPASGPLKRADYLSAADIPDGHNLLGSVVFNFACFGAGTPYRGEYAPLPGQTARQPLAKRAFTAALPARLLTLPGGGALAVIGHIDRAWQYSYQWKNIEDHTGAFKSILYQLMSGKPVGLALEEINERYAAIAAQLTNTLQDLEYSVSDELLTRAAFEMACNNDARGYAITGDPAVVIPMAALPDNLEQRPAIELNTPLSGTLPVILEPKALSVLTGAERAAAAQENQALGIAPGETAPDPEQPADPAGVPPTPGQPGLTPGAPFATPLDGLALALQVYGGEGDISFEAAGVSYGLADDAKAKIKQVVENLNAALGNLSNKMVEMTGELAALDVATSLVDDLDTFDPRTPGKTDRRILTRVSASGDIQVYLARGERLDEDTLALHQNMVREAMSNRLEVARALAEMIAGLFGGEK